MLGSFVRASAALDAQNPVKKDLERFQSGMKAAVGKPGSREALLAMVIDVMPAGFLSRDTDLLQWHTSQTTRHRPHRHNPSEIKRAGESMTSARQTFAALISASITDERAGSLMIDHSYNQTSSNSSIVPGKHAGRATPSSVHPLPETKPAQPGKSPYAPPLSSLPGLPSSDIPSIGTASDSSRHSGPPGPVSAPAEATEVVRPQPAVAASSATRGGNSRRGKQEQAQDDGFQLVGSSGKVYKQLGNGQPSKARKDRPVRTAVTSSSHTPGRGQDGPSVPPAKQPATTMAARVAAAAAVRQPPMSALSSDRPPRPVAPGSALRGVGATTPQSKRPKPAADINLAVNTAATAEHLHDAKLSTSKASTGAGTHEGGDDAGDPDSHRSDGSSGSERSSIRHGAAGRGSRASHSDHASPGALDITQAQDPSCGEDDRHHQHPYANTPTSMGTALSHDRVAGQQEGKSRGGGENIRLEDHGPSPSPIDASNPSNSSASTSTSSVQRSPDPSPPRSVGSSGTEQPQSKARRPLQLNPAAADWVSPSPAGSAGISNSQGQAAVVGDAPPVRRRPLVFNPTATDWVPTGADSSSGSASGVAVPAGYIGGDGSIDLSGGAAAHGWVTVDAAQGMTYPAMPVGANGDMYGPMAYGSPGMASPADMDMTMGAVSPGFAPTGPMQPGLAMAMPGQMPTVMPMGYGMGMPYGSGPMAFPHVHPALAMMMARAQATAAAHMQMQGGGQVQPAGAYQVGHEADAGHGEGRTESSAVVAATAVRDADDEDGDDDGSDSGSSHSSESRSRSSASSTGSR